jgi:DNA invertase Pin-like site-specific DNA recombinase
MTEKPRLLPYIRQSRGRQGEDEDSSLSLTQQEESIRAWGAANGYEVLPAIRDHDETGRTMHRPGFLLLKEAARPGTTIAVWKYDRFARNLIGQELAVDELERLGVEVRSITEPPGKLPRQLLGSISEYYSDQLSERLVAIRASAALSGKYLAAVPAYGLRRRDEQIVLNPETGDATTRRTGPVEIDPAIGPVMVECFERVAAGEQMYAICRDLHARGIPTQRGVTWEVTFLRRALRNPIYRGVIRHRGREVAAADAPRLVSDELWYAVQDRLNRTARTRERKHPPRPSWVEGLIEHACGRRMYLTMIRGKVRKGDGGLDYYPNYVCQRSTGNDRCGIAHLAVSAPKAEAAARACLIADLPAIVTIEQAVAQAERAAGGSVIVKQRAALERRRQQTEKERARARQLWIRGDDDEATWDAEKRRYADELAAIDAALTALPTMPDRDRYRVAGERLRQFAPVVSDLEPPALRAILDVVGRLVVEPAGITVRYDAPFRDFVARATVVGW